MVPVLIATEQDDVCLAVYPNDDFLVLQIEQEEVGVLAGVRLSKEACLELIKVLTASCHETRPKGRSL